MSKHLHNISAVLSAGKFVHLSNFYIDYLPHWNALFILYCHPLHPALLPVSFLRSLPVNSTVLFWYIVSELGSILENAEKMGAPIPPLLKNILEKMRDSNDDKNTPSL